MIDTNRVFRHIAIVGVCCMALLNGCAQQAQPQRSGTEPGGAKIALKPVAGERTTYKISAQALRNIKWEGPVPQKASFEASSNDEKIEMTVTEDVKSVDAKGRAVVQVTINRLKCLVVVKNQTTVDFDSTRQSDINSPLARFVGQSYTMEVEPNNYPSSLSGLEWVISWTAGWTAADRTGRTLMSAEAVAERQAVLLLPRPGAARLKPGDKWSRVKTFPFGLMGLKSYEKIYTLKEVRDTAGHQIAVIDMNAIPTSEIEGKYRSQQAKVDFPRMFDTNETYTGGGEIDLTGGKIDNFHENLRASWVAAMPANTGSEADANEPVVLRMTAVRNYNLERVK
jgi:hypothetical protein